MKNVFKKAAAFMTAAIVGITSLSFMAFADDSRQKLPENEAMAFVDSMGAGWNLGNGFDAANCTWLKNELDYESAWCGAKATKALIKTVKDAGFKTIRIPVSWHNHVDANFNISTKWMDRVKEVVDWSLNEGLYVILNTHHDIQKGTVYPSASEKDTSVKFLKKVWSQIAEKFRNYDNRLIFEALNEPRLSGTSYEWWYNTSNVPSEVKTALELINTYNQTTVDTVRAAGGNNKERYILVGGYATSINDTGTLSKYFEMPKDSAKNRLIADVHYYGIGAKSSLQVLDAVYKRFTSAGIPAVVTEYGLNENGYAYSDKTDTAVKRMGEFVSYARNRGISVIIWDNNYGGKGISDGHKFIDRASAKVITPEIVNTIVKSGTPALKTSSSSSSSAQTSTSSADYTVVTNTKGTLSVTAKVYSNKVRLSWEPYAGAQKYGIYWFKDGEYRPLSTNFTGTAVVITKMDPGTSYEFIVRPYVDGKWMKVYVRDLVKVTTLK